MKTTTKNNLYIYKLAAEQNVHTNIKKAKPGTWYSAFITVEVVTDWHWL